MDFQLYVWLFLLPFSDQLSDKEKSYGYYMQDNAATHTTNNFMDPLDEIFDEQIISQELWLGNCIVYILVTFICKESRYKKCV
jgi:hypothetical protein